MIRVTRDSKYAPCGYLVMRAPFDKYDEKNTILFQSDWDFPGLAQTFGWNMSVEQATAPHVFCSHDGTDGTITCPVCGLRAGDFISAAIDYLDEILDEKEVEDPGYFPEPCVI